MTSNTIYENRDQNRDQLRDQNWEREIAELLTDLSAVQQELLDVLSEKRDRMAANDLEGMSHLAESERLLGQRLKNCHDRRCQLLEHAQQAGLPASNLSNLTRTLSNLDEDAKDHLQQDIKQAVARMRLLQHHSLVNWVVTQKTLLHLSQLIGLIAAGGRLPPTYGKTAALGSRGALVDQEV